MQEVIKENVPSLVEVVARRPEGNTVIETLVEWAEDNGFDYMDIAKCLSPNQIQTIQEEAVSLNMLKGKKLTKLPLI